MSAPLPEDDIAYAGVAGQAALLRDGTLTSTELVELLLRRIERLDPALGAFRVVTADAARRDAAAADEARRAGEARPLLGVPIAVKDNVALAGTASYRGTGTAGPAATEDGPLVAALRAAGLVVLGKTNLPELALWGVTESSWHGVTRNPWSPRQTPGGSSGGSAAAVAAGLVPAAHGTDGLGSIRIPAASCGLVGLKPGRPLVPMEPDPHWEGMSAAGFLTRTVADQCLLLEAVGAPADVTSPAPPARLRIAASVRAPLPAMIHAEVRRGWDATLDRLDALGHEVIRRDPPYAASAIAAALVKSWLIGNAEDVAALPDPTATEPRTRRLAAIGRLARPLAPWASRTAEEVRRRLDTVFDDADVLVLPTTATLPPRAGALAGRGLVRTVLVNAQFAPFTGAWNLTGHPALNVPSRWTPEGLPVGVQLVGPRGGEGVLLSLAASLEPVVGWPERRPPLG